MLAAAWVTAIATVGLLLGAIVTARYAIKTFTTQTNQLNLLELQRRDEQALTQQQIAVLDLQAQQMRRSLQERDAQAAQDRSAQAQRIMVWQTREAVGSVPGRDTPWQFVAHIDNRSEEPVTEVKFEFRGPGRTVRNLEAPLNPGEQATDTMRTYTGTAAEAIVYFRDSEGVRWRRHASSGELEEIPPGAEMPGG